MAACSRPAFTSIVAAMAPSTPPAARGLAQIFNRRRVFATLALALLWGVMLSPAWTNRASLLLRTMEIGLVAMIAFGIAEQWPRRLPRWIARWVLQVIAVAAVILPTVLFIYIFNTEAGAPPFWKDEDRLSGFGMLVVTGLLFAPWIAVTSLVRQRDSIMRNQALAFQLERSELERKATDARLRLLQSQVEPHFLFNTLANIRELVDSGSPQASAVLNSLIAYLRAAVPRINDPATTLGQEIDLVRAYLELMQMRMPDRLQFSLQADAAAQRLRCPPMTLLALVENAVRHGIDPSEEGGRIDVRIRVGNGRCHAQVCDTGVGLREGGSAGLGTGLSTLRERLHLIFGAEAHLTLAPVTPHGTRAELDIPAWPST
jgi:Histidine kinase